jgi:hypothetical protein
MNEKGIGRAWELPMNKETLEKACKDYSDKEGRARFYDVAIKIADAYPLQASIIILAVWNVARFRFIPNKKYGETLDKLKEAIDEGKLKFESLEGKDFRTFNFNEIGEPVKKIYSKLSEIEGVKHTGASKVMHLLNRDLFLMWDSDMRKEYGYPKANEDDYLHYLKKMQDKVKNIELTMPNKTLPKIIDEFNFMEITFQRLQERKRKRMQKMKERQKTLLV